MRDSGAGLPVVRVVEGVSITLPLDMWLTIKAAARVSSLSARTLRSYLHDPSRPLPHVRVGESGGRSAVKVGKNGRPVRGPGKVLIRYSDLVRWLESWRLLRPAAPWDLGQIVERAFQEVQRARRPARPLVPVEGQVRDGDRGEATG